MSLRGPYETKYVYATTIRDDSDDVSSTHFSMYYFAPDPEEVEYRYHRTPGGYRERFRRNDIITINLLNTEMLLKIIWEVCGHFCPGLYLPNIVELIQKFYYPRIFVFFTCNPHTSQELEFFFENDLEGEDDCLWSYDYKVISSYPLLEGKKEMRVETYEGQFV